jgi:hypothetical protein
MGLIDYKGCGCESICGWDALFREPTLSPLGLNLCFGSPFILGGLLGGLHLSGPAPKQTGKIDRINQQRRKSTVAYCRGHDVPGERKQQPWTLNHDERLDVLGRDVLDAKHPRKVKLKGEQDGRAGLKRPGAKMRWVDM